VTVKETAKETQGGAAENDAENADGVASDEAQDQNGTRLRVVDDGIKRRWYAIHTHSGQEGHVKKNLLVMAEQNGLIDLVTNILVPMEEVAEIKSGQKKVSKRKFFPGYVLAQLPEHPERNAELWHLVKNTPGVTGFIGSRTVPVPLEDAEVNGILEEIRGERERPKPKVKFEHGERVKIIDGPFSNFMGSIDEMNLERGKLKIMVEIFERLTSVEVEFWQVEKV
jgi:transcriptional antiterminator NusG